MMGFEEGIVINDKVEVLTSDIILLGGEFCNLPAFGVKCNGFDTGICDFEPTQDLIDRVSDTTSQE